MSVRRVIAILLLAISGVGVARAQNPGLAPNEALVGRLTQELNITPKQATGGTGAILSFVKGKLSAADFSKIASAVPGMDGFLQVAPSSAGQSALVSFGPTMSGGNGMSDLVDSFHALGLTPSMIRPFASILQQYISSKGAPETASLFASTLE